MYSRPPRQDLRVPHNYSGSIFDPRPTPATPVEDLTRRRPSMSPQYEPPREQESQEAPEESMQEKTEAKAQETRSVQAAPASLLSPFGALGTEEILLIALALIVFQGGKDPELGLILLALLFIN